MSPQGDKSSYSSKQRRMAGHIEDSEMRRGRSRRTAERIGWATVNKRTGGARGGRRSRTSGRRSASSRPKRSTRTRSRSSRSRSR